MNKGFTLIELMIVISIIAILAAVAVPAYDCHFNNKCEARNRQAEHGIRCVNGYVFANYGRVQVMNSQGHGIPCGD